MEPWVGRGQGMKPYGCTVGVGREGGEGGESGASGHGLGPSSQLIGWGGARDGAMGGVAPSMISWGHG